MPVFVKRVLGKVREVKMEIVDGGIDDFCFHYSASVEGGNGKKYNLGFCGYRDKMLQVDNTVGLHVQRFTGKLIRYDLV